MADVKRGLALELQGHAVRLRHCEGLNPGSVSEMYLSIVCSLWQLSGCSLQRQTVFSLQVLNVTVLLFTLQEIKLAEMKEKKILSGTLKAGLLYRT